MVTVREHTWRYEPDSEVLPKGLFGIAPNLIEEGSAFEADVVTGGGASRGRAASTWKGQS
jgi:hypothetical protein